MSCAENPNKPCVRIVSTRLPVSNVLASQLDEWVGVGGAVSTETDWTYTDVNNNTVSVALGSMVNRAVLLTAGDSDFALAGGSNDGSLLTAGCAKCLGPAIQR